MLFVDESIQHNLGYICVGFAHCDEPVDGLIHEALVRAGLEPGIGEYKSGARMGNSPALHALRDDIGYIVLRHCKVAVYIAPTSERSTLLPAVEAIAAQIVANNQLPSPHQVFVDGGIGGKRSDRYQSLLSVASECDSKTVVGIQLADYVAYHCSYLLKCTIEGKTKSVLTDLPTNPGVDEQVDLDWIIRTEIRRNFFAEPRDIESIQDDDWFFNLAGYGSFFSDGLSDDLRSAAYEAFQQMYFGCVW